MRTGKVLLIYPSMGFSGNFVRHAPLSLLYASMDLVARGVEVEFFDQRLYGENWREPLSEVIKDGLLVAGISVMSGTPIKMGIELTAFLKQALPQVPVVWGGPHPTFYPETVFTICPQVDYIVSGYGSRPFDLLVQAIEENNPEPNFPGIYYQKDGQLVANPSEQVFEYVDYKKIPYHLIKDYSVYGQLESKQIIFSMYSAYGCPYKCTFCSSPAYLKGFKHRWEKVEAMEVVDHVEYVQKNFGATYIYFIDDDSFVNLKHVETIIDEISRRKIPVELGFRGARVNEIKRMSDEFLDKLAAAGTDIMHIGAESGSNRILEILKKDCTVEDIIAVNQKLARHGQIKAAYNFIMGVPGETLEDMKKTRDLMLRLIKDNPSTMVFTPNKFRPLPGTELFEVAREQWDYKPPKTTEDWITLEAEGDHYAPWFNKRMISFSKLLLLGSYFIDHKIFRVTKGDTGVYKFLRAASWAYTPISNFRFRTGFDRFYIEYFFYQLGQRMSGLIFR